MTNPSSWPALHLVPSVMQMNRMYIVTKKSYAVKTPEHIELVTRHIICNKVHCLIQLQALGCSHMVQDSNPSTHFMQKSYRNIYKFSLAWAYLGGVMAFVYDFIVGFTEKHYLATSSSRSLCATREPRRNTTFPRIILLTMGCAIVSLFLNMSFCDQASF